MNPVRPWVGVLIHDNQRVHTLKLEQLGNTSIASSLSYLDNGRVGHVGGGHQGCVALLLS